MEPVKPLNTVNERKKTSEKGKLLRSTSLLDKKKDSLQHKEKCTKVSMIPVPKVEGGMITKSEHEKKGKPNAISKCSCDSPNKERKEIEEKLKLVQEKEKSIADYYHKIEVLVQKFHEIGSKEGGKVQIQESRNPDARKITSEPLVYNLSKKEDVLTDLENNVHQISEIWLKTSTDLSCTLNNLKNNPILSPTQFALEKVRIQLAIKQTKSLTLIKTRNIITEVKKLFRSREMIRTELENLVNEDGLKKCTNDCCLRKTEKNTQENGSTSHEVEKEKKTGGTGDSFKQNELKIRSSNDKKKEIDHPPAVSERKCDCSCISPTKTSRPDEEKPNTQINPTPEAQLRSVENWERELKKKKESITNLNNRIFELQKICNYHSLLYNQLQAELCHFHEKIQWNQVLWKQIGKLKEQIRALQMSNKQLESQKSELQLKISKLDEELERMLKINHTLNQKEFQMNIQEPTKGELKDEGDALKLTKEKCDELRMTNDIKEEILAGKQNAINQLKTILDIMKDQENFAQKQIFVFKKKIDELEKSTKA